MTYNDASTCRHLAENIARLSLNINTCAEANRIQRPSRAAGGGTKSTVRLQASEAIIRHLSHRNNLAIIVTHDTELVEKMKDTCDHAI